MELKWHPIIDGDLSGIPTNEKLLFTVFDEKDEENYVACAYILEFYGELDVREATAAGQFSHEAKNVKAWMELPEPYEPGRCDICKYQQQWSDYFGNQWLECQLGDDVFSKGCPLE